MRVDVGLLGRRLLLQCEQRRPNAGVEVYGQCNTNTNTYTYTYTNAYSNPEANSNAEAAPDSISSVIGGPSTPISLLYIVQSSLNLQTDKSGESSGLHRSTASQDRNGA